MSHPSYPFQPDRDDPMKPKRDFKGIWISKDIWFDRNLSSDEKLLLAEIHSLDGEKGCWAGNEYFCEFFDWKERKLQTHLSRLKAAGYIHVASFDGRTRILKVGPAPKNDKEIIDTPGVEGDGGGVKFDTPSMTDSTPHPYSTEGIVDILYSPPPLSPAPIFTQGDVIMPEDEYRALIDKFGASDVSFTIHQLDLYAKIDPAKFKRYKSHAAVVQAWIIKEKKKEEKWKKNQPWKTKTHSTDSSHASNPISSDTVTPEQRLQNQKENQRIFEESVHGSKK